MTLNPICEHVETAQGVPLTVTGVAQCKIMTAKELLQTASEQFLGKDASEIEMTILQTLEGHLRAILGTLSVEEVRELSCFINASSTLNRQWFWLSGSRLSSHCLPTKHFQHINIHEYVHLIFNILYCIILIYYSSNVQVDLSYLRTTIFNRLFINFEVEGTAMKKQFSSQVRVKTNSTLTAWFFRLRNWHLFFIWQSILTRVLTWRVITV